MTNAMYKMTLKDYSSWYLSENGRVLWDGTRRRGPFSEEWRIIGFTTRHNAHRIISLTDAANGEDIGQGWVHDYDHGTRRMWGTSRRAVSVRLLNTKGESQ